MYLAALPSVQDKHGFVESDKCDSITFSALLAATGATIDVEAAEEKPGRWLRRPTDYPECWAAGESRSTISRDGLLAVMWWAWTNKRLDVLERMWAYGESRSWFMGDGRLNGADTFFGQLYSTLAQAIYTLGGEDHTIARLVPVVWADCADYKCHIQALHAALRFEVYGGLSLTAQHQLEQSAARQPWNPLLEAVRARTAGQNESRAQQLLEQSPYHPTDRLPTSADHCEAWPVQRDATSKSFTPCPDREHTWSGGDWLFTDWYLRRNPTL